MAAGAAQSRGSVAAIGPAEARLRNFEISPHRPAWELEAGEADIA